MTLVVIASLMMAMSGIFWLVVRPREMTPIDVLVRIRD
jgi:hypothetical protein